jgi:hypothetical protein
MKSRVFQQVRTAMLAFACLAVVGLPGWAGPSGSSCNSYCQGVDCNGCLTNCGGCSCYCPCVCNTKCGTFTGYCQSCVSNCCKKAECYKNCWFLSCKGYSCSSSCYSCASSGSCNYSCCGSY